MIKKILGITETPFLKGYRGYGSRTSFVVMGHVSQDFVRRELTEQSSRLQNALYFLRLYFSKPMEGHRVSVHFNGKDVEGVTNSEGFFEIEFTPHELELPEGSEWIVLDITLLETQQVVATPVLIEGAGNTYGVISDVDDTVLISNASNKAKLLINTLTKNYLTRSSFKNTEAWYKLLVRGSDGNSTNPIFYVSSSHWNLYEFLKDFFKKNDLPDGPLLLKRFSGFVRSIRAIADHSHKQKKIEKLLQIYPTLRFILIGDSGQHDPTLYANIVEKYPERILAIYIRDVVPGRDPRVEEAIERVGSITSIISFEKTKEAVTDARKRGFIV